MLPENQDEAVERAQDINLLVRFIQSISKMVDQFLRMLLSTITSIFIKVM